MILTIPCEIYWNIAFSLFFLSFFNIVHSNSIRRNKHLVPVIIGEQNKRLLQVFSFLCSLSIVIDGLLTDPQMAEYWLTRKNVMHPQTALTLG